jgi:hypothetical protein
MQNIIATNPICQLFQSLRIDLDLNMNKSSKVFAAALFRSPSLFVTFVCCWVAKLLTTFSRLALRNH